MDHKTEAAYVYKWTYTPTYQWYVGVRYAKNCHPDDGYICSSKTVKPRILSNPDGWRREIIAVGSPEEMRDLEMEILSIFYDKNDPRCLNRNVSHHPPIHKGESHPQFGKSPSAETRQRQSETRKKLYTNPEFVERSLSIRIQEGLQRRGIPTGPHPEETRQKIRSTLKVNTQVIEACKNRAAGMKDHPNLPLCRPVAGISKEDSRASIYYISSGEAGRRGFSQSQVNRCCTGRRKSHKGYIWRYATIDEIREHFPEYEELRINRHN